MCPWNARLGEEATGGWGEDAGADPAGVAASAYRAVAWPADRYGDAPLPSLDGPGLVELTGFRATAFDHRDRQVDDAVIVWTSSNHDVLEAAADGVMTALAPGWVWVEASAGPVRERRVVRVTSTPSEGLVASVLPTFGDPQLQQIGLGAAGGGTFVHQGRGLREPVASPDGSLLAFVMETQDGGRDLFVINADGSDLWRLTTNPGPDDQPAWAPDGETIAFRSGVNGLLDVWVVQADGSGLRNLTDMGQIRVGSLGSERPDWSPDGQWVAYAWVDHSRVPSRASLRMIRADGSESRVITPLAGTGDTEPAFSPDGSRIAFRRSTEGLVDQILVVDVSGNLVDTGAGLGSGRTPRWSADGEWLAYIRPATLVDGPGALVLRRMGWEEERILGSALDVDWMPSR